MSRTIGTISHDGQFWVAVVERFGDDGGYSVARFIFGAEPGNPELLQWAGDILPQLQFVVGQATTEPLVEKRVNPKRARRATNSAMASTPSLTRAQEAIKAALALAKMGRRHRQAEAKEDIQDRRHAQKTAKRKQARRGR